MRLDSRGHTQRADHQRHQTHQRKKGGRLPQPLFDQRMRFGIIGNQPFAECLRSFSYRRQLLMDGRQD